MGDRRRQDNYNSRGYRGGGDGTYGHQGGRHGGRHDNQLKRKREDDKEEGNSLLYRVIRLCDRQQDKSATSWEEEIEGLSKELRREISGQAETVQNMILDCAVELGTKTQVYATLVGLLNAEDHEFAARLVAAAQRDFDASLATGARDRARLLLRFFAALAVANVLYPSSVLAAIQSVVDAAVEAAKAGSPEDSGRQWQPYTDYLVYVALLALPWGGDELAHTGPAEVERLFSSIDAYMALRPRTEQPALRPFFAAKQEGDTAARSDSGGASFLPQAWEAVRELHATGTWAVEGIHEPFRTFEARLAAGQPHELGQLTVPLTPPGIPDGAGPMEAAAAVAAAFPPRGGIRLLAPEHTRLGGSAASRLVAEECMLDTITFFDGDRIECAARLGKGLNLPANHEPLLAETLFAQMLKLPQPSLKPIAYSTIMVDLCKLMGSTFPRSMSACVRECFSRLNTADPEVRGRFARWLAYHLSNFEFVWPWDKWAAVLEAPPWDQQRRFVTCVLGHLVRLSYWERVRSTIPESFLPLLPPKPEVQPVQPVQPVPAKAEDGGVGRDGGDGEADGGGAAAESGGESAEADKEQEVPAAESDEVVYVKKVVELMQGKCPGLRAQDSTRSVEAFLAGDKVAEHLGGPLAVLRMVARAVLVASSKTYTHLVVVLERYHGLLAHLLEGLGIEGEVALVDAASRVWAAAPQRGAMAVDRLMTARLVSPGAAARWALGSAGVLGLRDELAAGLAWEVLHCATDKALARVQDATVDCARATDMVSAAHARVTEVTSQMADGPEAAASLAAAEEEAVQAVGLAEQEAQQQQERLEVAKQQQQELLLEVFTSFRELLTHPPSFPAEDLELPQAADGDAVNGDADFAVDGDAHKSKPATGAEAAAWFEDTLAHLRAFTRRYHAAAAPLAGQLEGEVFAAHTGVPAAVRESFVNSLHI